MEWNDKNLDRVRDRHLLRAYGITLEDYDRIFTKQGGVCAICGKPPTLDNSAKIPDSPRARRQGKLSQPILAVDHDHDTGEVRGLLCLLCNRALGLHKDDITLVRFALKYLEERN
jgi:hypothetical protein